MRPCKTWEPVISLFVKPISERGAFHKHNEGNEAENPFWRFDEAIGEGRFFGEQTAIRLKAHLSEERYHRANEVDEVVSPQTLTWLKRYGTLIVSNVRRTE